MGAGACLGGRRRRGHRGERGAATLLVVALAGVLMMIGLGLAAVAGLVVDHRTAQAAADLAALAGASSAQLGLDACGAASDVARRNGAMMRECRVEGEEVWVTAVVAGPHWRGLGARLVGHARAGPA